MKVFGHVSCLPFSTSSLVHDKGDSSRVLRVTLRDRQLDSIWIVINYSQPVCLLLMERCSLIFVPSALCLMCRSTVPGALMWSPRQSPAAKYERGLINWAPGVRQSGESGGPAGEGSDWSLV